MMAVMIRRMSNVRSVQKMMFDLGLFRNWLSPLWLRKCGRLLSFVCHNSLNKVSDHV